MDLAAIQRECLASDETYRTYYERHFSLRREDRSIPQVERVTQQVLRELSRLQRSWESSPAGAERLRSAGLSRQSNRTGGING